MSMGKQVNIVHLDQPDKWAIDDGYRSLPRFGEANIRINKANLSSTVDMLEAKGFCGILLSQHTGNGPALCIRAFKGKNGPCYDTGRMAIYKGMALAALDDDHHIYISGEGFPICEKTANVLGLPPYSGLIHTTPGNEALLIKLDDKPVPFNCDTFEERQEALYILLKDKVPDADRAVLFYPGPFKLLILHDGTMVRRGKLNSVPSSVKKDLIKKEKLFKSDSAEDAFYKFFQKEYVENGPNCLLDNRVPMALKNRALSTDFSKISNIHPTLKQRLFKTIQRSKKYFILTGSDPSDAFGCCPSEEVQSANELVQAGILDSFSQPVPTGACPVTTYAFKDEIKLIEGNIEISQNQSFREEVVSHLKRGKRQPVHRVLKWVLLLFVFGTMIFSLIQLTKTPSGVEGIGSLYEQIQPVEESGIVILLFHNQKRCTQCLNMEDHIREFIEVSGTELGGNVQFKLINMNQKQNYPLIQRFRIYTSTPVIIRFSDKQEDKIVVLNQAWKIHNDPHAFEEMLRHEFQSLNTDPNE